LPHGSPLPRATWLFVGPPAIGVRTDLAAPRGAARVLLWSPVTSWPEAAGGGEWRRELLSV
jgi:hypothetical protein